MKTLSRRTRAALVVVLLASSIGSAGVAGQPEVSSVSAPFSVGRACYKVPGLHYTEHCPSEMFLPATSGAIAAGGSRSLSMLPPDIPTGPIWTPVITKMMVGTVFTHQRAGELSVVAELVGVRQTINPSSMVCLMFAALRTCLPEAAGGSPVVAGTRLQGSARIPAGTPTEVLVSAETNYPGFASAHLRVLTLHFTPDEYSTDS